MPTKVEGDYSALPECIREVFPYVEGEFLQLKQAWVLYHRLFMEKEERTKLMAEMLGPFLGVFQNLLQDELFLAIARLTDKDSKHQANISLSALMPGVAHAKNQNFKHNAKAALDTIERDCANIRRHRHKRIAHFDLTASLNQSLLPQVTFGEIKSVIGKIEELLTIFNLEFAPYSNSYGAFDYCDLTGFVEETVCKAKTYDLLEADKTIPFDEYERRINVQDLFR